MGLAATRIKDVGSAAARRGEGRLVPSMSPLVAWAFGVGTAIGWGSFVVTSNKYLLEGGPLGSILGMVAGALIMVAIGCSYAFLMNRYPSAGGGYTYLFHVLGPDYGFLTAWFLVLTYLAVFWANVTSLPLFCRYFLGDLFRFGYLYTIFGYDVYFGEVLLSVVALALVAVVGGLSARIKGRAMLTFALVFTVGIVVCAAGALIQAALGVPSSGADAAGLAGDGLLGRMEPLFLPGESAFPQVGRIALMTPWAFIGFESISHSSEEFTFTRAKSSKILLIVIGTTTLLYVLVMLLSASAYPPEYASWLEYLADLPNLGGLKGLPAFYAANHYLGDVGTVTLMLALLALVLSSLVGNTVALSRLLVALSRDGVVPKEVGRINAVGAPSRAFLVVCAISVAIPFLGRTAIGWVVDITTIGSIIVYALVSYSAAVEAHKEQNRRVLVMSVVGCALMVAFGVATMLPSVFSDGEFAQETYFLVASWALIGFAYFRLVLQRDEEGIFGRSLVVWGSLLVFVLFSTVLWMRQADHNRAVQALNNIRTYMLIDPSRVENDIQHELEQLDAGNTRNTLLSTGVLTLALAMMMSNYRFLRRRKDESDRELGEVRSVAYRDALTGVKNKAALAEWETRLNAAISAGRPVEFAMVVLDVNDLKFVNDTFGHKAGDEYLREACMLVCRCFKHSPVFRMGGDEFLALLEGTDYDQRELLLDSFDRSAESKIGSGTPVIAAGAAIYEQGRDLCMMDVMARADDAMYERKRELKTLAGTDLID